MLEDMLDYNLESRLWKENGIYMTQKMAKLL
jgi:hypothetical protein